MGRNSGETSDSNGINVLESHVMRSLWKRFQRKKKKKKKDYSFCVPALPFGRNGKVGSEGQ